MQFWLCFLTYRAHHQQSLLSSDRNSLASDTHPLPQTIVHDIASSQGQPPSLPSFQPEVPPGNDTNLQKHEPAHEQYQEPLTPHRTPSSPTAEQSVSSHQAFFVPSLNPSSVNTVSAASEISGYDYFAGIATSQISRSRTVSMASSHDSSTVASSPSPSSRTVSPSSSTLQPQTARRISNSGSLLRDQRSRNAASRASPVTTSSGGAVSESKRGQPAFTTAPPQPISKTTSADNHRQPLEQSPMQNPQQEEKSGSTPGKSGWFSGLFGRMKGGGQEIYLPDDSNPSVSPTT
ncbi:unnamed protein product [Hydatigera taeniaeformis]|uniref:Uncharacterized protein n=1 Tax=Hydatigena taeniaeformis TaxID=6205 RepID=A0A0R3XBU9_HYDTA|nr:unnamed protein product [Hydatigera taeniaeformis]